MTRSTPAAIIRKISRLRSGQSPRMMDLFSGCGGLTLGFQTAGFRPVASVEIDRWAAESHGINFALNGPNKEAHHKARNIVKEEPGDIFHELGISGHVEDQIDVMVGGPPCQAFARVGRARLRDAARQRKDADADFAHISDSRVNLYQRYLHYVEQTKPVALLMENVPDILNHAGRNVAEIVAENLSAMGYVCRYTLLNASSYGVPQTRERMFLIAMHEALGVEPEFPKPTHWCEIPPGYESTRSSARKLVGSRNGQQLLASSHHRWIDETHVDSGLLPATTAKEALADLPPIDARDLLRRKAISFGRKDPSEPVGYTTSAPSTPWSKLMREWPQFSTKESTTGHVIRYLPRDYKIFHVMEEGWEYPRVWQWVEEKRARLLDNRWMRGETIDGRNAEVKELVKSWTLPYNPTTFSNRWWKLYADKPVRTLMAHLGKDSYSHIHFDSEQARTISVREAARLQSFPDGFRLSGSLNPAFKQIGNAVPPLMAYALAVAMRSTMGLQTFRDIRIDTLGLDRSMIGTTPGRE